MERKFNVGDRVRIVGSISGRSLHIGKEATIIAYCAPTESTLGLPGWYVDLPTSTYTRSGYALFHDSHLKPVYDGNERVAWSECAWQPKDARVSP